MTIHIILADDHPIIRNGVKNFLSSTKDIEVIGEAENGDKAVELVNELKPDVLLLDMEMPNKNGIQVAEELKNSGSSVQILAFSAYDDPEFIRGVLNLGVAGYITKDEPVQGIIDAIRGAAGGEQGWFSRKIRAAIMSLYNNNQHFGKRITPREIQVCELIFQGKTNKEIAYDLHLSNKTVEKYVNNLFQKLNVASRVELAVLMARDKMEAL